MWSFFVLTRTNLGPCFIDDETWALRGKEVVLNYKVIKWLNQFPNSGLLPNSQYVLPYPRGYIVKRGL